MHIPRFTHCSNFSNVVTLYKDFCIVINSDVQRSTGMILAFLAQGFSDIQALKYS